MKHLLNLIYNETREMKWNTKKIWNEIGKLSNATGLRLVFFLFISFIFLRCFLLLFIINDLEKWKWKENYYFFPFWPSIFDLFFAFFWYLHKKKICFSFQLLCFSSIYFVLFFFFSSFIVTFHLFFFHKCFIFLLVFHWQISLIEAQHVSST